MEMIEILIRYLGIKTKLISEIKTEIIANTDPDKAILDLFAGSNIVAQSLMDKRIVYTNDIQKYSHCVGELVVKGVEKSKRNKLNLKSILESKYYKDNYKCLIDIFNEPLKKEKLVLDKVKKIKNDEVILVNKYVNELKILYDNQPYTNNFTDVITEFSNLDYLYSKEFYRKKRSEKNNSTYMLFTLNYAMPYFSLQQSILIDSYRYAIDKMYLNSEIDGSVYNAFLCALVFLLQNIVCSVGDHFAQPQQLKLIDEKKHIKELKKIISKKNFNIYDCLNDKINEIANRDFYSLENRCFNRDCMEIIKDDSIMDKVDGIYIDPPYTNAHYSRFYHILETLVEYNYPDINFKGRYSEDRIQSDFCIKSKAIKAFDSLIETCSLKQKKLFISYSDTSQCILSKKELIDICEKHYHEVKLKEIDHMYRNFGQKAHRVTGKELLISCR